MNELDLLRRIRRMTPAPGPGVIAGIGDDCAIYRPPGAREDLLFTTDMMIEDVHFRRATHPADSVGWKALARGLSDIAAMGGEPRFCLLSLALASWADQRWIDGFYRGFLRLARRTCSTTTGERSRVGSPVRRAMAAKASAARAMGSSASTHRAAAAGGVTWLAGP